MFAGNEISAARTADTTNCNGVLNLAGLPALPRNSLAANRVRNTSRIWPWLLE